MDVGLVVATVGLVLATLALVYFTRQLVTEARASRAEAERTRQEMEEARHLTVRPRLTFDPHVLGGMVGVLLIRNLGRGPALDVCLRVTYRIGEDVDRREWTEPSVAVGESHELKLPSPYLENVIRAALEEPMTIHVDGTCADLYGRVTPMTASIDLSAWVRQVVAADERVVGRRKLPELPERRDA